MEVPYTEQTRLLFTALVTFRPSVSRNFTAQISGLETADYWDRLKILRMYSQERRRERYRIIFVWKVLQGLVQGYPISSSQSPRRGRLVKVAKLCSSAPSAVKKAREASLSVQGARLFNLLPGTSETSVLVLQTSSRGSWTPGWSVYLTSQPSRADRGQPKQTLSLTKLLTAADKCFTIDRFLVFGLTAPLKSPPVIYIGEIYI